MTHLTNNRGVRRTNHPTIVHDVHTLLITAPIKWRSVEDLCNIIFHEYNPSLDTKMREIVDEVKLSHEFHTHIISGRRGIKAAESKAEVDAYEATETKRLVAAREIIDIIDYRKEHDTYQRLPLERELPPYDAFAPKQARKHRVGTDMAPQAQNAPTEPTARYNPPIEVDDKGQVRMQL